MFDYAGALQRCARGDRAALQALFEQEAARLVGVARRILGRQELAEEAVQDAFLQIWRLAGRYDPELGSARGWIYAVLRNRALNLRRDGAREDLLEAGELERLQDAAAVTDDAFARLAESSRLRGCLQRLEAARRACLLLAYVAGFSHGEIAGRLGLPLGTAKAWIRRGLAALKDCMA